MLFCFYRVGSICLVNVFKNRILVLVVGSLVSFRLFLRDVYIVVGIKIYLVIMIYLFGMVLGRLKSF